MQDTFVAVWRGAGRYRGSGEVPAWIWGIGIRRLIDRLRRSPVIVSHSDADEAVVSAEDQVILGVEHGDLGVALGRLSPETALGRAGHGARRPHDEGGGDPARHPPGNREDPRGWRGASYEAALALQAKRAPVPVTLDVRAAFSVGDDGIGFDPATVRQGVGMRSMVERAEALGGSLDVRSSIGQGTVVAGRLPLTRP